VLTTLRRHVVLLQQHYAEAGDLAETEAEVRASRDIRKHIAWYLKGYPVGQEVRAGLATVPDLAGFDALVARLDAAEPYPGEPAEGPRGRTGSARRVSVPDGWLDSRELDDVAAADVRQAELSVSGG
jgi:hypothetical protein